jgi:hypothetical protein
MAISSSGNTVFRILSVINHPNFDQENGNGIIVMKSRLVMTLGSET